MIGQYTRESLVIDVAGSIRSIRVTKALGKLLTVHGFPTVFRSDHRPEFVSRAAVISLERENIDITFIDPGNP
jgi:putative transposase